MNFDIADLNIMILGKHPNLKFLRTMPNPNNIKRPIWAVFSFEGQYYGASCQGTPSNILWDEGPVGQVACVQLYRAVETRIVFCTVDDLFNITKQLLPLDPPFQSNR